MLQNYLTYGWSETALLYNLKKNNNILVVLSYYVESRTNCAKITGPRPSALPSGDTHGHTAEARIRTYVAWAPQARAGSLEISSSCHRLGAPGEGTVGSLEISSSCHHHPNSRIRTFVAWAPQARAGSLEISSSCHHHPNSRVFFGPQAGQPKIIQRLYIRAARTVL